MKKRVLTIISIAFFTAIFAQASSKVEVLTEKEKIALTLELCKKKMGIDNFNFMKDVFNDENVVIMKCKEALSK